MSDELRRALAGRDVGVAQLVAQAEAEARAEVLDVLRAAFRDDLLRRAAAHLAAPGRTVLALVGVAEGVRPIVHEVAAAELDDEHALERLLREHNAALIEALEDGAVLPFRFGTTFPDRAALDAWIAERRDRLAAALDRLRGTAEWSVEVLAQPDEQRPDRYLESRLATAVRPDVRARLAEASADRAGDAYLVDRAKQDAFDAVLAELEREGYRVRVTGPWPPYSFASLA